MRLLRRINREIVNLVTLDPQRALARRTEPGKDAQNQPLFIDEYAETAVVASLKMRFRNAVTLIGEESFQLYPDYRDLSDHPNTVGLMDIVDGTDLLLRGLGNWCSSLVFFEPKKRRILASVVVDHEGNAFYAADDLACAYFLGHSAKSPVPLHTEYAPETVAEAVSRFRGGAPSGPSKVRLVKDSAICFYGQKPASFLSPYATDFGDLMRSLAENSQGRQKIAPALRIYNLGGTPMIVRVANGTMDAVFDLTNPKPHDMVPGAYIALRAGASLESSDGTVLTDTHLADLLRRPADDGVSYILAATPELCSGLQRLLCEKSIKPQH